MQVKMRNLRIVAAVGLGGAVIWATAPFATNYVSSEAVVNAPLNTVRSPINGRIVQASPDVGTTVEPGQRLVSVVAEVHDRRNFEELLAQRMVTEARIAAIDAELTDLATFKTTAQRRVVGYRQRTVERLRAEARETKAAIASAEARRTMSTTSRQRAETLARYGRVSKARLESTETQYKAAAAEVTRLHARLAQVKTKIAAAQSGIFIDAGWNDVPYSQQRIDEIRLRRAELSGERRRLKAKLDALKKQISAEKLLTVGRDNFQPIAPSAGVVWTESGTPGETVVAGDVLVQTVDCGGRFIEFTLPETYFADIARGDVAHVQLKGSEARFLAPVSAVLGAGASFGLRDLAASVPEAERDHLRVLVSLKGAAIDRARGAFCQVGRTAEVRLDRRSLQPIEKSFERIVSWLSSFLRSIGFSATGSAPHKSSQEPG